MAKANVPQVGTQFGKWIVIGPSARKYHVSCRCECGRIKNVAVSGLSLGRSLQCKHCNNATVKGESRKREYHIWRTMLRRCTDPEFPSFKWYGARGISVCERWRTFEQFLADMGRRPSPSHSLERPDGDGNYEPGNCEWATTEVQSRNRANNVVWTFNGESKILEDWAKQLGVKPVTLRRREQRHGLEYALTTPVRKWERHKNGHQLPSACCSDS